MERLTTGPIPTGKPDALLSWMAALADPTRLRLLRLLEHHELGVVDLCDILQLPQSTISRHLKVLGEQHWLRLRRQGTTHLYRMILDELEPATRRLWLLAREQTDRWATISQDDLRLRRLLHERQTQTESFFAGAAADWDKLRQDLFGSSFATTAILSLLPENYVVADLGCGTGATSASLAPHVKQVIAIDNSPAMLKAAKRRLENFENIDLRRADLESLSLQEDTCDAALMLLVLSYVTDAPRALAEMSRILKPAGRAVIVDLLPHDRDDFRRQMGQQSLGFDPTDLTDLLVTAGLSNPSINPLPPEPEAKGPALFIAIATKSKP